MTCFLVIARGKSFFWLWLTDIFIGDNLFKSWKITIRSWGIVELIVIAPLNIGLSVGISFSENRLLFC